jgi:hypothetical protein
VGRRGGGCAGTGAALGLLHGVLTVTLALSQHVAGLGLTLLATSLASYAYRVSFPKVDTPPTIEAFAPMAGCPSPVLNAQTPLTLLALLLVPLMAWLLYRTPLGLAMRTVGENPAAVEGQGLSVAGLRIGAVMAGSALMGVAGSFLTLSAFNAFFFNMVNGRGWVCVAWWCLPAGGRARRCLARCCLPSSTRCSCGCSRPVQRRAGAGAALSGVPDAALCDGHRGAGGDGAARPGAAGADEALPRRRTLVHRRRRVSFGEALRFWLKLGFISFGGPAGQIALMHTELVERRRWISERRFMHALNYCMLLPGPEAQQLATYIGWLMHRTWGGIVAWGALFVLPSLFILVALSWVYVRFGRTPGWKASSTASSRP